VSSVEPSSQTSTSWGGTDYRSAESTAARTSDALL